MSTDPTQRRTNLAPSETDGACTTTLQACFRSPDNLPEVLVALMDFVLGPLLRRRAKLHEIPIDRYEVRLARTLEEYEQAFRLVHYAYVYLGIEDVQTPDLRLLPQHLLPEANVIVVYEGENLVGTITITADSPAGLPLDKDYPAALQDLRLQGARLAEYCACAVVERCWGTGVTNLLYLSATAVASEILGASHVVAGVNPASLPYFQGALGFGRLGGSKGHATLHAPVAGLLHNLEGFERFLRRHYRKAMATGLVPADHFFGAPLPCAELPFDKSREDLKRWKMPREVLRSLIARRSDVVAEMNAASRRHLNRSRSRATLSFGIDSPIIGRSRAAVSLGATVTVLHPADGEDSTREAANVSNAGR